MKETVLELADRLEDELDDGAGIGINRNECRRIVHTLRKMYPFIAEDTKFNSLVDKFMYRLDYPEESP